MVFRIAGISFDHMHMGDLLRMVHDHPDAEIAALYDPNRARMQDAIDTFDVPDDRVFTDLEACLAAGSYDMALLCCATADHASMTERLIAHDMHIFVEKPFAASAGDARRMIAAMDGTGRQLAINWPMRWVESHVTAKRLIDEGLIGALREVHFYGGNRGPLWHGADRKEITPEEVERLKPNAWWYKKASGGGALLDYLGYGATLGTWYMNGKAPFEVTCTVDAAEGIEVDEHAIAVLRYDSGLSRMESRWGTFTDPWTHQPQPVCGFIFVGSEGTISSPDYATHLTMQTRARPERHQIAVDPLIPGERNGIEYVLGCLSRGEPVGGPLAPALCLTAQRIVDTAAQSAREKRTLALLP